MASVFDWSGPLKVLRSTVTVNPAAVALEIVGHGLRFPLGPVGLKPTFLVTALAKKPPSCAVSRRATVCV
jgi:hypothetical protein